MYNDPHKPASNAPQYANRAAAPVVATPGAPQRPAAAAPVRPVQAAAPTPTYTPAPTSAWEEIQSWARLRVAATHCTMQRAIIDVSTERPDLYNRYCVEQAAIPYTPPAQSARTPRPPSSAWTEIERLAKARASETGCTMATAITAIADERPDLYRHYRADL